MKHLYIKLTPEIKLHLQVSSRKPFPIIFCYGWIQIFNIPLPGLRHWPPPCSWRSRRRTLSRCCTRQSRCQKRRRLPKHNIIDILDWILISQAHHTKRFQISNKTHKSDISSGLGSRYYFFGGPSFRFYWATRLPAPGFFKAAPAQRGNKIRLLEVNSTENCGLSFPAIVSIRKKLTKSSSFSMYWSTPYTNSLQPSDMIYALDVVWKYWIDVRKNAIWFWWSFVLVKAEIV